MKKRTFVIGDIHGAFKALKQVIARAHLNPEDKLIFLGDYVDGWSESPAVIDYLIALNKTYKCRFLRGNHDALFDDYLSHLEDNELWLKHGGVSTVQAYAKTSSDKIEAHHNFLKHLENYFVDDQNRLFLHAGFSKLSGPQNEYHDYVFYWDRTLWEMAIATDPQLKPSDPYYPERLTHFKEIFIGHTPVNSLGTSLPHQAMNVWNIDTGAGFKGKLSMLEINTKEVFQSDEVWTLYPNEKGRN